MGIIIDKEMLTPELCLMKLNGRLDARSSQNVKDVLGRVIGDGVVQIAIDMEQVPFIDSSGLSALVSGLKGARKHGGSVVLCKVQPQARTIFSLTMLDKVFSIYSDLDTALSSFGQ